MEAILYETRTISARSGEEALLALSNALLRSPREFLHEMSYDSSSGSLVYTVFLPNQKARRTALSEILLARAMAEDAVYIVGYEFFSTGDTLALYVDMDEPAPADKISKVFGNLGYFLTEVVKLDGEPGYVAYVDVDRTCESLGLTRREID